jgi:hypothetical protein
MKSTILLILVSIIGLAITFWGVALMWQSFGVTLTLHGWIAYGLGVTASLLLAGGLFFLLFKSAREGYDDIDRPEDFGEE